LPAATIAGLGNLAANQAGLVLAMLVSGVRVLCMLMRLLRGAADVRLLARTRR
jgi:hypothetical protein